jgi:hypothetical protein
MLVLKIEDGHLITKDIVGDLTSLQNEVGGFITMPHLSDELYNMYIDIVADDEGLLKPNPKVSLAFVNEDGSPRHFLVGNILFVGYNDEGETLGLTEDQIKFLHDNLLLGYFADKESDNPNFEFSCYALDLD